MSDKRPDAGDPDLQEIGDAALVAAEIADNISTEDRLRAIEQKIAAIEPLLEQMQVNSNTGLALGRYVADLQSEQIFFNRARYAVGCVSLLSVVGLAGLLALAIFHARSPLLGAPAAAIAAFVVGLVSGIVFLLVSFTKGVFRSTAERHADGFLPPALEKAVEILDKISGGK